MDPVTHLVGGLLIGRAFRRPLIAGVWLTILCGMAAVALDATYLLTLAGPGSVLAQYRGLGNTGIATLSVTVVFFLLALPFRGVAPRWGILLAVFLAALSHLYLNAFTSTGIQPLAPFTDYRIALGSLWFFDPILLGALLLLFLGPIIFRTRGLITGWIALFLLIAYPLGSVGVKQWANRALFAVPEMETTAGPSAEVQPDLLSPLFWKVVRKSESAYDVRSFSAVDRSLDQLPVLYEVAPESLMDRLSSESPLVKSFLERTHTPIIFRREGGDTTRLVLADLCWVSMTPIIRNHQPDGAPPMSLRVELDVDGKLIDVRKRRLGRYLSFEELPVSPQAQANASQPAASP
ncbi:metal-dependent hydrolase [Oceanidesulfovibrio marinus]|uniref:Metal-dependent hydrolase n=1 Tax=Oceanidesulfovibrio marinus TaxID=370038 RepID=A0ABX6NB52_9BACT|nr:metal-dependent hydrolase [Oceanidesulfovibrio marinus]QJT07819.1 metal-dependent hydrolase [Oceanidesulfovibrio marinus]